MPRSWTSRFTFSRAAGLAQTVLAAVQPPTAAIEQSATEWIMALWKSPGQPWATRISIAN